MKITHEEAGGEEDEKGGLNLISPAQVGDSWFFLLKGFRLRLKTVNQR